MVAIATLLILSLRTAAAEAVPEVYRDVDATDAPAFSFAAPIGAVAYTPGRGLRVGDTGLTLGGYSSISLE